MSSVAWAVWRASSLTSLATTENPCRLHPRPRGLDGRAQGEEFGLLGNRSNDFDDFADFSAGFAEFTDGGVGGLGGLRARLATVAVSWVFDEIDWMLEVISSAPVETLCRLWLTGSEAWETTLACA